MNIKDLNKIIITPEMPIGTHIITFLNLQYRTDKEGNITGAFIHNKEFRPLFIPIFEETDKNFMLFSLLGQLNCDSLIPDEINSHKGTEIIVSKYHKTVVKELQQNEIEAILKATHYENYEELTKYEEIYQYDEFGQPISISVYNNLSFNPKTRVESEE